MTSDPREILEHSPMNAFQITAVVMCVLLNALDGFDVLSISFASPGIAEEWGINRAELGIVLSMELIGMAVGSVLLGGIADRIGRRPTILGCLVVMSLGMYLAAVAKDLTTLSVVRFVTGLGIGGMLASINAMVAEYSNRSKRNLSVTLMASGYPLGVIAGGSVASMLLVHFDWRSVFYFGSAVTASLILFVWFLLPESVSYLAHKQPRGALEKINRTLRRMGHETIGELPSAQAGEQQVERAGVRELFSPSLMRTTIVLTLAYFLHILTFYYIIKWIPKIVVDMGYAASTAGGVLVWANVGGASGAILLGLLATRYDIFKLIVGVLFCGFVMVGVFGMGQETLWQLALIAAIAGFFTNSAIVGLYALFARRFPTRVRAGGTGFVIGVGRGGAALGPVIAGFLFEGGFSLQSVSIIMAMGSLLAAIVLLQLKRGRAEAAAA